MNCLHSFPRFSALPTEYLKPHGAKPPSFVHLMQFHLQPMAKMDGLDDQRRVAVKAISDSKSSSETSEAVEEVKSDVYSSTMTEAMGASLTYRHELGINYNFIRPDLIVGSCLQSPKDVDKLRNIGVKTIFCLQQDPDLQYFGVDIKAIQNYARTFTDIEHIRAEIRDFDGFDLRMRLPAVVGTLYKAVNRNGGVSYIHCTAGMGRAPAVALAYMYWVQGYGLNEAHQLLLSKRSCCPKLDAIKSATADILTDLKRKTVEFKWRDPKCTLVEISGLDVGWGQKIPFKFDEEQNAWILRRELPEGRYEYKYVIDGEWICNQYELLTPPNDDGQVNNYVEVISDDPDGDIAQLRKRLTGDDPHLTSNERLVIRQYLEQV